MAEKIAEDKDESLRLREEIQRLQHSVQELSILNEISTSINSTQSLNHVLESTIQKCLKLMHAEQGAIMLLDEKITEKPFQTMLRKGDTTSQGLPYHLDAALTGWMLKNQKPLNIPDLQHDERFRAAGSADLQLRSLLSAPLLAKGRMIGLLTLFNKKGGESFNDGDKRLLAIIASQSAQVMENARLLEKEKTLLHVQQELKLAWEIQTNLLPTAPPAVPGYDIAGRSIPAKEVGGDYFDFISLDEERLLFCLGDVSGKGIPAALLMANLQAIIRSQAPVCSQLIMGLAQANNLLFRNTSPEKFATFFFGCLEPLCHRVRFANAGHPPALRFSAGGMERLAAGGMALGCLENESFQEAEIILNAGDVVVVYSDGISEAMNAVGEEFGEKRLIESVSSRLSQSAAEVITGIVEDAARFSAGMPQFDDMTLVVLKRIS